MPYQAWTTLETWDAPDANLLGSQLVFRFTDATQRSAQLGTPVAGMLCHLATPGRFEYYTGTAWVPLAVLPPGGTTGQLLAKLSDTDGDVGWITPV